MDFIARADNHSKKRKKARRHSNLWANMTCNLLSCEKHKWQQHCDFISGYRSTDKIAVELSPAHLPPTALPSFEDLEGSTHLHLSRVVMCDYKTQIERLQKKRDREMGPLHHKNNVWDNRQLLPQRQGCIQCPSSPYSEKERPQKYWQRSQFQGNGRDSGAQVLLPSH